MRKTWVGRIFKLNCTLQFRKDGPWVNRMGDIWASLWAHSMTRTSSHPCVFLIDIVLYWPRFVESLQYLHQWNKCFVYMLYDACLYDIYIYIYIYWNSCMMKFLWNFILEFFSNKSGVVMGPALSSLVAPQVVITTSGAARGGRVGFIRSRRNPPSRCAWLTGPEPRWGYARTSFGVDAAAEVTISKCNLWKSWTL